MRKNIEFTCLILIVGFLLLLPGLQGQKKPKNKKPLRQQLKQNSIVQQNEDDDQSELTDFIQEIEDNSNEQYQEDNGGTYNQQDLDEDNDNQDSVHGEDGKQQGQNEDAESTQDYDEQNDNQQQQSQQADQDPQIQQSSSQQNEQSDDLQEQQQQQQSQQLNPEQDQEQDQEQKQEQEQEQDYQYDYQDNDKSSVKHLTKPRLPVYVGRGYNIFQGNPLSQGIDPGFQHTIFDYQYQTQESTEDNKFLIPDDISYRKMTACSFSTEIKQIRGTESYQQQLKQKAKVAAGFSWGLFKASFSLSRNFLKIHNKTSQNNSTITHASAQCQCYQMSLDLFTPPGKITKNFWKGIEQSYRKNDWSKFVKQFGTHFAHQVVMGGRATQQIEYDSKSISEIQSLKIDLKVAAKASFALFHGDASFESNKYTNEISYSKELSKNIHHIYVGGQPPKTGKIMDWQQKIINDPMPITYKLIPISQLFKYNPNPKIDQETAIEQFEQYLNSYCQENKCLNASADKPKPPPATVTQTRTSAHGGAGGRAFQWQQIHPLLNIRKIMVRSGKQIDNIQIQLSDGITTILSPQFGGTGGSYNEWVVPKNQYITQVQYRSSARVDSLTFITNKGTKSPKYGGNGGVYNMVTFPTSEDAQKHRIIGIYGRAQGRLDSLGFILGKTQYQTKK